MRRNAIQYLPNTKENQKSFPGIGAFGLDHAECPFIRTASLAVTEAHQWPYHGRSGFTLACSLETRPLTRRLQISLVQSEKMALPFFLQKKVQGPDLSSQKTSFQASGILFPSGSLSRGINTKVDIPYRKVKGRDFFVLLINCLLLLFQK